MDKNAPKYLRPYRDAIDRDGAGFSSLLWSCPASQHARFEALTRLYNFAGKSLIDVGCGRADLLDYLLERNFFPNHYVGIEAIEEFASAAERKQHRDCTIVRADFLREPRRLFVGADAVVYCGSLNTLSVDEFYQTLERGFDAAAEVLVFNFLCSPALAAAQFLTWHDKKDVRKFLEERSEKVDAIDDYRDGDCTMIAWK
jgi:hypothetical protein